MGNNTSEAHVPLCPWADIYLCLGSATFRIHKCVFSQYLRTHVPITDVTCVQVQKWENICQLRHKPFNAFLSKLRMASVWQPIQAWMGAPEVLG